ncbi:MAG TPA: 5'/3'-nucleotidase SurE [Bacteroidia bacterium]|jgi:5'-nucleotidase|nr:5'/3'-nucleotidase SurE [Bacteroidia bacterium]
MNSKKLILVTNDDGITAPGILFLSKIAKQFADVCVIAPDKAQSGMGHAITLNSTLRIEQTNLHHVNYEYSCSGTPVDCVKLGVNKFLDRKPDMILSGINHGANLSINVIYSGTMSAALEGSIEGIPSVGFSLCDFSIDADFSPCEHVVKQVIEKMLSHKFTEPVCLNVNIPKLKADEMEGIKACRAARGNWIEEFDERKDPSGKPYYWLTGKFINFEEGNPDTDLYLNKQGYVTVVPVSFDLTNHGQVKNIAKLFN